MRYRMRRWLLGFLGLGVLAGAFVALGHSPIGWIGDRWADLRGSLVQVQPVRAVGEPTAAAVPDFPASNLVDNKAGTAWAVNWSNTTPSTPAIGECLSPASPSPDDLPGSALILPEHVVTVRSIAVAGGLLERSPLRKRQWRPKSLQLAFSNGTCQRITLADAAGLQQLPLDPVDTAQIRISVLDAYPPGPDQPVDQVAISEVWLFSRP